MNLPGLYNAPIPLQILYWPETYMQIKKVWITTLHFCSRSESSNTEAILGDNLLYYNLSWSLRKLLKMNISVIVKEKNVPHICGQWE